MKIKPEVLHYVQYVRFHSELPREKLTRAVQEQYPKDTIRFIEADERGVVYEITAPMPGRH